MKLRTVFSSAVLLFVGAGWAQAADNCEPLRLEIEQKIIANGVKTFTLTVVDAHAQAAGQEVGQCGQGSKKIMYVRGKATER